MDTIRKPLARKPRPCLVKPSLDDLVALASLRVHDAAAVLNGEAPPRIFPTVEHTRATFFTHAEWEQFGNLESERARQTYTLTQYPDRGIPRQCQGLVQDLLSRASVLDAWTEFASRLRETMEKAVQELIAVTEAGLPPATSTSSLPTKASFLALPVAFETTSGALELWRRAVEEIAVDLLKDQTSRLQAFLEVHAFVKDPSSDFAIRISQRTDLSRQLLDTLNRRLLDSSASDSLQKKNWEDVAAQVAAETSYLAVASADPWRVNHVLFSHHQQLGYFDAPLSSLERAEFSKPSRVVELAREMLLAVANHPDRECHVVPIVAGPCPGAHCSTIIIDGNNRATAVMLLRLLATCAGDMAKADEPARAATVDEYCRRHDLGIKWRVDLIDALDAAVKDADLIEQLKTEALESFAHVSTIPALLAQEECFHTVCLQRKDKLTLLLPAHQFIFNRRDGGLALPQRAAQAHGMTLGTAVLAVR